MARPPREPLAASRQLLRELRGVYTTPAPHTLLPGVLARLGDVYTVLDTQIGALFIAYNQLGISAVMRADDVAACEEAFRVRFGRAIHRAVEPPAALLAAIKARLQGASANLRFDLRGLSEFERAVLLKALEIPAGEVRPYSWIAREIGRPKAVRAVGSALGDNPVPLLIPCHRVVRSDGRIGDYIFGSETKRAVLEAEGAAPKVLEELGRSGVRYFGDPDEGTFCLPTCGGMHLRTNQHYLKLHSIREALAVGLEPCQSCRPTIGA